ncbi:MAG TPA: threonine/serine exporter family protein [Galbitalea sp.]|jgi:uncharacterized membrane protein YjjP (DUF1212 family)
MAAAMTLSEESVAVVSEKLRRILHTYGEQESELILLPTAVFIQTDGTMQGRVISRSTGGKTLRFDQIAELYQIVGDAERKPMDPVEGINRLNAMGAQRPRFGWITRTVGHAILTVGLCLLLVPSWTGVAISFGLGLLIGLAKLVRSSSLRLVLPVVAAFVSGVVVFWLALNYDIGNPAVLLVPPLVTFLPGGMITTGTMELAVGELVSGSSRLVSGLVQLALLAFGVLAAGALTGASTYDFRADLSGRLPWWVAMLGVVCFAIGIFLHFSCPTSAIGWVFLALVVAYAAQAVGALIIGSAFSGFAGAVVVTPLVLFISSLRHGAPSQLTFLPAFWLLVPGAAGLIGLTTAVGGLGGFADFAGALVSVLAIALGVLIGTALYRGARSGARGIQNFSVELPAAIRQPEKRGFWGRMVPGTRNSFWGASNEEAENSSKDGDSS